MHILFATGEESNTKVFNEQIYPSIERLNKLSQKNIDITIAIIYPGAKTLMQIDEYGIVRFQIKSIKSKKTQIPKFTPSVLKDLNNFFSEFKPEIVHSFDQGFIGLITQSVAISKNIPYILSISTNLQKQNKMGFASKIILKLANQVGISDEFINKFYKNSAVVISHKDNLKIVRSEYKFRGKTLKSEDIKRPTQQYDLYKKIVNESEKKPTRLISTSTVLTAAAIVGSLLAFVAVSTTSKIKTKKKAKS